jgi:hypothetical protein
MVTPVSPNGTRHFMDVLIHKFVAFLPTTRGLAHPWVETLENNSWMFWDGQLLHSDSLLIVTMTLQRQGYFFSFQTVWSPKGRRKLPAVSEHPGDCISASSLAFHMQFQQERSPEAKVQMHVLGPVWALEGSIQPLLNIRSYDNFKWHMRPYLCSWGILSR